MANPHPTVRALVYPALFVIGLLLGLAGREVVRAMDKRMEQVAAKTIRSIYAFTPTGSGS